MNWTALNTAVSGAQVVLGLLLTAVVLALVGSLLTIKRRKGWWLAAAIGFICSLVAGVMLRPWEAVTGAAVFRESPDEMYWLAHFRFVAAVWVVDLAAALLCLIVLIRRARGLYGRPTNKHLQPTPR